MLIVVAAALFGIWRYRTADYFKWVGILFVWMLAAAVLFGGGGTLQDPGGDGIVTRQIRQATGDGPVMGIFAIAFLIVYWGGAIFFIMRMVRAARQANEISEAEYDDPEWVRTGDSTNRQVVETLMLLAFAATWIWYFFWLPMQTQGSSSTADPNAREPARAPLTIEKQLRGVAAEVNAQTPQSLGGGITLQRATAAGTTLTYHYTTDDTATPEQIEQFVLTEVLPKVCDGPLRKDMKDLGVSYEYAYRPKNLADEVGVVVTEEMCAKTEG